MLKSGILPEPALAGREDELTLLQHHLELASRGQGTAIFVSGEAGSGKTRLASEFLRIAKKKGAIVLSGWCLSDATVPYFPFLEALESFSADNESAKTSGSQQLRMKTWLTEQYWAGGLEEQYTPSPQNWRDQAFAAITRELLLMSSSKPTILFVDDIHWADSASLSLLHYIARAISSERILLLATFRSEEIAASVEGQPPPLLEALRIMGREGVFKEIKLQSLDQSDVGRIVESMLGGMVNTEFVERLTIDSRGVPLFVVESLRMLHDQGSLVHEHGQWRVNIDKFGLPDKVRDVILRRLDSLKPSQRRILDAASAIGERFDPKLVAAVVTQDNLDVLESLAVIAGSTLLVNYEGDYFGFVHAKFREMLYDQISAPLKKEYHSRIAEKLETSKQTLRGISDSDLAYHYTQAGNKEKSVKYALAAGKDALAKFSNKEALKHFTYVLQITSEDPEYLNEKTTSLEGLGEAFFANSMFKEATRTFEQLSDLATGVVKLRALRRAMDAAFFQGEFAHLLELTKRAEPYASVDRLESGRVLMNRARAVLFLGNGLEGFRDFEAALRIFQEEFSLPDVARTLLGLGGGSGEEGLVRALRAVALYDELGDTRGLMDACNRAGQSFGYRMLANEALDVYAKALRIGEKIGDFNRLAEAAVSSSWLFETEGNLAEALSRSLKALECSEETDSEWVRGMTYANLVRQYAKLGDLGHAEEYFERLRTLPPQVLSSFGFVQFGRSRAILFAAKNQWTEANQYFEECLKSPERLLSPLIETAHRKDYSWVLGRQKQDERAKVQVRMAQEILEKTVGFFEHPMTRATLMAPREVELGKEFTVRIDVVNVSRKTSVLAGVERLISAGLRVTAMPSFCNLQHNSITMQEKMLGPFQVEPIKLGLLATKAGILSLEPRILYVDDLGKIQAFEINPVRVTVQPTASATKFESVVEITPAKLEFRSKAAQKAFDYLLKAFIEDFRRLRLPLERSGWRTLMDIVKHGKVSKYSAYGSAGNRGQAISELDRLSLVEVRVFTGERGRGGNVIKLRVAYDNATVRSQIELRNR